jgi:hypothetical protein
MVCKTFVSTNSHLFALLCHLGLHCRAVRSNRFQFDTIFDSKGAQTFRFDIDLIKFKIRFDRKPSQQSWKTFFNREIRQSSRGDSPGCHKKTGKIICGNFFVNFSFFTVMVF